MRKPAGGGPAGVALRAVLVEKKAAVAGEEVIRDALRRDAAGRLRASIVKGLAVVITGFVGGEGVGATGLSWRTR